MALPEAVSSGLLKVGEMAAAVAASVLAVKFALWQFKLARQQLALERAVSDSVEVQETGFPAQSSELWASPDQMIQHCARCGGEPVFDPGMMDWTCPTCGFVNEGGQDLDPNDPDNYELPEGLRGGFDEWNAEPDGVDAGGICDECGGVKDENGVCEACAAVDDAGGYGRDSGGDFDAYGICDECGAIKDENGVCEACAAIDDAGGPR